MTVPFVVKTSYYTTGGGGSWTGPTTQSTALSFNIEHEFDKPAEATVVLSDPTGSIWRAMIAGGTYYLSSGIIYIEQPAATTIFDGRIMTITQDQAAGTITLLCRDWMDQLDDDRIIYDMREDLNGSGLRQSYLYSDCNNATYVGPAYTNGANYYVYDDNMSWAVDQFNAMYLVYTGGHAGPITTKCGPYDETLTAVGTMTTDTPANGEERGWTEGSGYHTMRDEKAANPNEAKDWNVVYDFRVFATEGSLYSSGPTGMRINLVWWFGYRGTSRATVHIYDHDGAAWVKIGDLGEGESLHKKKSSFEVPEEYVPRGYAIDTDGVCHVKIDVEVNSNATTELGVAFIEVETDLVTSATSTAYLIDDTIDLNGHGGKVNCLKVDTDMSIASVGVWDTLPYSICDLIKNHVNGLVTDNDSILAMTTSVEATTGISTKHFNEFTPLGILRHLANSDGAVFWTTLGGREITYKKTFNDGAPTELTDAGTTANGMVRWHSSDFSILNMYNEAHVYGVRVGDHQIFYDTGVDAGGDTSKSRYRTTRVKAIKGTGVMSTKEAKDIGTAFVTRYSGVDYPILGCTLVGLSALRLGSELNVNSTYHSLTNEKYAITKWAYDSESDMTEISMQDRNIGFKDPSMGFANLRTRLETVKALDEERDPSGNMTTQTWS